METARGQLFKLYGVLGPLAYLYPAPFGRYSQSSQLSLNGRIAWVVQETVGLISILYYTFGRFHEFHWFQILVMTMFVGHYINRSLVWPLLIVHSISPSHLMVALSAATWQYLNGYLQAEAMARMAAPTKLATTVGTIIFIVGAIGNVWHDKILANLRKNQPHAKKYRIPHGGLFEFIFYPNYLLEWFEWSGYAIVLGEAEGWWFVVLEILVMAPRALTGYQWYKKMFKDDFPQGRKIVLPYVW